MTKEELIKVYGELKSKLETKLNESKDVEHMDSYKKGKTGLEILTLIINDLENLTSDEVLHKPEVSVSVCKHKYKKIYTDYIYECKCGNLSYTG